MTLPETQGRRRGRRRSPDAAPPVRQVDYRRLSNPFPPVRVFSEDRVEAIHAAALDVLERLGMKVLSPEARALYRAGGAIVDDASQMVRIGRDMIAAALDSAPRSIEMRAGARDRDVLLEPGALAFLAGAGCPNASDLARGRRPATLGDYRELTLLTQQFDALHMLTPLVEPQDVPINLRHYATIETQLTLSDKVPVIFARGTPQVEDGFQMIRDFRGLSDAEFAAEPCCYTIVNTNSPRQLDIPMAQGLMDFARAGQMVIVTPFCLMGAMAPVTVAGALTLSHAEALAGIVLTQLARPGAPVCYGAFASNVDMKSGSPAFGTPEQVKASLGAGQLARHIGLPWRCAAGCAANVNDAQAAHETQMSAWGAVMAGATVVLHGAGWIEGGLTLSYEKFITDMDMIQTFAELCSAVPAGDSDLALDALLEVQPGGHFFGCAHTMERYATAFYQPVVADWSNFGRWTEAGAQDSSTRAGTVWHRMLDTAVLPSQDTARIADLRDFIARRTAQGGAAPES